MIEIKDLSVVYQSTAETYTALKDIQLAIPTGGTCAIIGPSGSGKSTLLKVLAGIITDFTGSVEIDGQAISPKKQKIGFIPQNYGLLPWKNVYENICLGLKIKQPREKIEPSAVDFIMQQLGIDGLGKRYPGELSGGQQQRVSLARAFLLKPDVLLMDEPFSALDAITREEIQNVFLEVWKKHAVSTVFVTHYVEEAVYLGQKIVILSTNPGKISKVIENPLFGEAGVRNKQEFFELSLRLRNFIKEDWSS
ncbi:ABC transporter ATP-binding protein [Anaerosinus massiliensis]|uniref:ABC transporter ATP-binding protein n=1 Tax=Massilibacillus massiliensis TaxID=1806837 RepID=UPI000AB2FE45|nr:ABC transporter ATP-binding protein [Massilibacillus massiliensis]